MKRSIPVTRSSISSSLTGRVAAANHHPLPHRQTAREETRVDDLFPGRTAGDLEDRAAGWAANRLLSRREPLLDPIQQFGHPDAHDRRAEVKGDDGARRDLRPEFRFEEGGAEIAAGAVELLDHALARLGEEVDDRVAPDRVVAIARNDHRRAVAGPDRGIHRDDAQVQLAADVLDQRLVAGTEAVDLVDEDQERQPGRAHSPRDPPCLGLHPLDGRDDQDDAVKNAQRAIDLGDEVGVTGGIDQVDFEVIEMEGDDRGFDGDPASTFQLQRVGLRRAFVDAADCLDDSCFEENPFGETGFTGVYMRQDPDVDDRHAPFFR